MPDFDEDVLAKAASAGDYEKHPTMRFDRIGDGVLGTVERANAVEVDDEFKGKVTKYVVDVKTTAGKGSVNDPDGGQRPVNIGETVTVWLQGPRLVTLGKAVKAAGGTKVLPGAEITVEYAEDRDTGKRSPLKVFDITYKAPVDGPDITQFAASDEPF